MRAMDTFVGQRGFACSAQVERGKDSGSASLECSVLEALRMNDRLQVEERRFKQGVDYNEVEMLGLGNFDPGIGHARGNDFRVVFAAPVQALQQFLPARRQNEDQDRVGKKLLDLQRALP